MAWIPPIRIPQDYTQLSVQEMADLLERILQEGNYTTLVLDVGDYGRDALPLLEKCQVIYTPIREDPFSAEKMREFEEYLEAVGNGAVMEKNPEDPCADGDRREKNGAFSPNFCGGDMGDFCEESAERTEEFMGQLKQMLRAQILAEMTYDRRCRTRRSRSLSIGGWMPVWRNSRRNSRRHLGSA